MRGSTEEVRVVVVDDEGPARAKLRRLLAAEPNGRIVGEAENGREAVRMIKDLAPDLLFLDVQMPELDGFGVIEAVGPEAMPEIVFVTAHDEHAVRAFEVNALDFILKPVAPARFQAAFARAYSRIYDRREHNTPTALGAQLTALLADRARLATYLTRLLVEDGRAAVFVSTSRVDRFEAERNYVRVHVGAKQFTVRTTITALMARLDPSTFLRVNRSTVVRLDAVRAVHPWSHGDQRVELLDGTTVTWSRRYRAQDAARFEVG